MTAPGAKRLPPEPKSKRKERGKKKAGGSVAVRSVAGWQPNLKQEFIGNGYEAACRLHVPRAENGVATAQRGSGSRQRPEPVAERPSGRGGRGASSRGELYAYYKRLGMLDVFFSLFPDP